jgi:hypothetical protein
MSPYCLLSRDSGWIVSVSRSERQTGSLIFCAAAFGIGVYVVRTARVSCGCHCA